MTLDKRKQQLLEEIITQHIKTAEPVGSKPLVEAGKFDLSPATIRNEMAELEKEGLVCQPYTSAGRIPTEEGYRYYLQQVLENQGQLDKQDKRKMDKLIKDMDQQQMEVAIKQIAKQISEMVDATVVVGFSPMNVYYTGISNLFRQPEFYHPDMVVNISQVIDHLDQVMGKIFQQINETTVLIGKDNPFSDEASVVISKYSIDDENGIVGILGPMRMDYRRNYNIINHLTQQLKNV